MNKEVSCQTTSVDTSSSPDHTDNSQLETQSVAAQGDMEVNEDSTVHKTTSTIFVDLSKLQESPPSDYSKLHVIMINNCCKVKVTFNKESIVQLTFYYTLDDFIECFDTC